MDNSVKAAIACLAFFLLGYAPPDDQAEAARLAVMAQARAEAAARRAQITEDIPGYSLPYDYYVADGRTYTVGTLRIHVGALDVQYYDGYCTSYCQGIPTEDGQASAAYIVGAPYIKMNGGAWLLLEDYWVFCGHDGPQLDIPDEKDLLPHSEWGPHRLSWYTFLLEHTPDPPCAREDTGYKQLPVCASP